MNSLLNYKKFIESLIDSGFQNKSFNEKNFSKNSKIFIIRHDVDRFFKSALDMAKVEFSMNIKSIYFFRGKFIKLNLLNEFLDLRHDVGIHHEFLSKFKSNEYLINKEISDKIKLFNELKKKYEKVFFTAHGAPFSKFDNFKFISENNKLLDFCEEINWHGYNYVTDVGGKWGYAKFNRRDYLKNAENLIFDNGKNSVELIEHIKKEKIKKLVISVHPERWPRKVHNIYGYFLADRIINLIKKQLISK